MAVALWQQADFPGAGRFPRERTGMQNGSSRAPLMGEQEKKEVLLI
jgi:hypothetical protein